MIVEAMAMTLAALPVPECPIDRAVYRLNTAPEYTAGFLRQDRRKVRASDLVFWLKSPNRTRYFTFFAPNGHSGTYITPDIDPRAAAALDDDAEFEATSRASGEDPLMIEFDAFDADLKPYDMPPQADSPAPARLFARQLVQALWYSAAAASGNDESAEQESMPTGMFEPAGCDGPPPPR